MEIVTIQIAKATLSELLLRVESGEEIVLARGENPVAKLIPFNPGRKRRRFGSLKGIVSVGPEFFEPMRDQELKRWE